MPALWFDITFKAYLEIIDIIRSKSGMENDLTDDYEKENKDPTTSLVLTNKNMELLIIKMENYDSDFKFNSMEGEDGD